MVDVAYGGRVRPARRRHSRKAALAMAGFVAVGAVAVSAGLWSLWARWPATPVVAAPDAPHLPVVVAEETFVVAPGAIRIALQRRPGPQERLDLVYAWPGLAPPPAQEPGAATPPGDRVYVTVAPAAGALEPPERLRQIWLRYVRDTLNPAPDGLALVEFRDGTPYQGEDLAWEENAPEKFLARCERPAPGRPPATCLSERIVGGAVVTMRFSREWLADWRGVAAGFDRLVAMLRPKAG
ncbi:hypothetical protein PQJ75_12800 [Rhodoplanes sp. TEM]|uniref:Uncharacterized protein n=1 Tax=Rhodoplanes tepidamans TaxID=200616 RepID=A0ABT5JEM2_RHOTP|nr:MULTISPECIES: hypothetical protein [Rhodoplanes]MDC7788128.1 hypothetical protein [Rhodoplanes tepidamans]MDC7984610.1 hypothetical protein [Rhodoplanes sp. TEM]MDQ0355581.1 hypothetical protein [Rhodoplanes tepidamans]